jgi:hypothetical protein
MWQIAAALHTIHASARLQIVRIAALEDIAA